MSAVKRVAIVLSMPVLAGLLIYVIAIPKGGEAFAVGLMTGAAAFAVGALAGFLFGIPRALAQQPAADPPVNNGSQYGPNTNLEQISDWLTKILVGVGLVQIGQIGAAIDKLAEGPAESLGTHGHSVAIMLLVSFFILGFLTSYLYTRLNLQRIFEPFRAALKKQGEDLTSALPLVRAQLDPSGEKDPSVKELADALEATSSGIRDEAFYLARNQRRANWRGEEGHEDRRLVDLVIPVFEALIELDAKEKFHRSRAELGYALKDGESRDYERARDTLSDAIRIRGESLRSRFPLYEFNRAFSSIMLDPAAATAQISGDLTIAGNTPVGLRAIRNTDEVKAWLRDNPALPGVAELLAKL